MTHSCSATGFEEDLSALLDGELDEAREDEVNQHLETCGVCRQNHDKLKSVSRLFGKALGRESQEQEPGGFAMPDIWSALQDKLPGVCESILDDLSAYLDGELIAPAREGMAQHLAECSSCAAELKQLHAVKLMIEKGLQLPDSIQVDLWQSVKDRIEADCSVIRSELSAYLDREVAIGRHRAITAHLLECPDCKDLFVTTSQTSDLISRHYQPNLPADFDLWPAIAERMKVVPFEAREARPAPVRMPRRRLMAVAAAVIGGVVVAAAVLGGLTGNSAITPVTAEAYLIDSSLGEPGGAAEEVVYDRP